MYISPINNQINRQKYDTKTKKITFGTNYKNFPNFIAASINETCNLKCHYCPNTFLKKPVKEHLFPMDLYKKLLASLKEIDYDGIFCFHRYNEPLLTSKAEEYFELANKYIPLAETRLYTNGMYLTKDRLESIQNVGGIKTIIVTEQSPEKSFIDRLTDIDENLLKGIYIRKAADMNLVNRGGLLKGQKELTEKNIPCDMPARNLVFDSYGKTIFCPDDYYKSVVVGDLTKQTPIEIVESEKFQTISKALLNGERDIFDVCRNCNRTKSTQLSIRIPAIDFIKNANKD